MFASTVSLMGAGPCVLGDAVLACRASNLIEITVALVADVLRLEWQKFDDRPALIAGCPYRACRWIVTLADDFHFPAF
jgi:hypothetical protein